MDSDGQAMLGWMWMRFVVFAVCGKVALVEWYLWVQFFVLGRRVRAVAFAVAGEFAAKEPTWSWVVLDRSLLFLTLRRSVPLAVAGIFFAEFPSCRTLPVGRGGVVFLWWLVVCGHVGANPLVDGDVTEWLILLLPSFKPYVAVWSVVWLDVLCEDSVDAVYPSGPFCFLFVEVVVA